MRKKNATLTDMTPPQGAVWLFKSLDAVARVMSEELRVAAYRVQGRMPGQADLF